MQLFRDLDQLPSQYRGGALTIGNFDGVHLGHARIVAQLCARAKQINGHAVVFTFDPHPVRLLRPDQAPPPLTWTRRKVELLGKLGVDAVVAYPTDQALLNLGPHEFFQKIVVNQIRAQAMIEGPNFFFGKNRAGDPTLLAQLCADSNISLDIVEPYRLPEETEFVSSSRIRKLIAAGDVGTARTMLTEPYRLRGMVTHGAGRGADIGFPTANLEAIDTMLPGIGVYAGIALRDGQPHAAAINIGPNPTFDEHRLKIEAHLIDYRDTLYGEPLELLFLERLREVQPFKEVSELVAQLNRDIESTKQIVDQFQTKP
ncbi:MAG: riboflavin biosynthesis protein RibF [Blastopirellula sp.]|nr:MAG: riboflavin biosynthesis protein RibF [Blastopirellula sp.]